MGLRDVCGAHVRERARTAGGEPGDRGGSRALRGGHTFYRNQQFASALAEFEAAHRLMTEAAHPNAYVVLYNLGQTAVSMQRERQALAYFEQYLAAAPPGANAEVRADAEAQARELRLRLALDQRGGWSPSPIGLIVAGTGAAAMIASAILGGVALSTQGDALAGCVGTRCTPEAWARLGDAGTLAIATDVLLWGGLAVLAAGTVLTFVLADAGSAPAATAACASDGCVALVEGTW